MSKQLVLMDHDGGVDDYLATMLLMTMDNVQPLGVVVTAADCYAQPAVSATRKILDLMGFDNIPVAESKVRGINPFPYLYRRDSFVVDHFPILNQQEAIATPIVAEAGEDFTVKILQSVDVPVTIMATGPLTNIATALQKAPQIEANIRRIVWMGGALNVPGNVEKNWQPGQDGSAEWNAYWDPISVAQVWDTNIEIIM
ncbi:MAG: nucleoside hydrolase, partial [Cyanobacteria bacterium J06635_10]